MKTQHTYQEPKEKDLEELQLAVKLFYHDDRLFKAELDFYNKSVVESSEYIITLEEAKQRGLKVNF